MKPLNYTKKNEKKVTLLDSIVIYYNHSSFYHNKYYKIDSLVFE